MSDDKNVNLALSGLFYLAADCENKCVSITLTPEQHTSLSTKCVSVQNILNN